MDEEDGYMVTSRYARIGFGTLSAAINKELYFATSASHAEWVTCACSHRVCACEMCEV